MTANQPSPLRGRDEELARVRRTLEAVVSGAGAVVVVEGRAGLGKTKLLDACAAMAADMSIHVGRGMAEPGRSIVELEALLSALFGGDEPLIDRRALRALQDSAEQTFWLLQDLQALIEEAAHDRPLLVCLDDLQWAGQNCAAAMRQLPHRLASLPVAWVLAFRPNQGIASVIEAKHELLHAGAEYISLGPLDREAVAHLASDILGAEPDDDLLARAAGVHGSPFLLVEFFRGLQDEHLVAIESGRATLLEDRVPHRITDSVHARLSRMSPEAERTALVAASLGRRFSLRDLADMTSVPVAGLMGPVRELLSADIFAESEDRLAFWHDLVREGARASAPSAVRRGLDRQAVDVLLSRGALPVEVAAQLADSAEPGDEPAIRTLLEAADALGMTDPAVAADLAGRALDLAPPRHPLRGPLVASRAIAMFTAGNADEARRFADTELRQSLPAEEEARLRWTVSGMFDISPDVRADNARIALALPALPDDLRALLWASLFHNLVVAVRTDEAVALRPKARDAVRTSPGGPGWFALELAESALEYQLSHVNRALRVLDAAERVALPHDLDARGRLADNFRASFLAALDRFDDAFEVVDNGIVSAHRNRQHWAMRMFETWRGRQLLQRGLLGDAATALDGRYSLGEADRIVGMLEAPNVVALGKIKIHTGDDDGAHDVAEVAKVMLKASAPGVQRHAAWYLALHAMSLDDPGQAHRWLCTNGDEDRLSLFPLFPLEVSDDPQLVRIAHAVGDPELATKTIETAERRVAINPGVRSFQAAAAHARGIWHGSVDDLELAVTLFAQGPRPLAQASALEDLARARLTSGHREAAVDALDRALVITAQAGASWDAGRVRSRLRALGIRRRVAARARPGSGPGSLTGAELAVARLAASGRTDRQIAESLFISAHTVNTHLRHIFDKLGINSRVALTRALEAPAGPGR